MRNEPQQTLIGRKNTTPSGENIKIESIKSCLKVTNHFKLKHFNNHLIKTNLTRTSIISIYKPQIAYFLTLYNHKSIKKAYKL